MKILVTGATGLLGNNLVRELLDQGHHVRCPVRRDNPVALQGLETETVVVPFGPEDPWETLLEGCDAVVHCAAVIHLGWTRMEEVRAINVQTTQAIANAARHAGVRMLHVSSVDTLAHSPDGSPVDETVTEPRCPPCNYVVTKTEAETVVHQQIEQGLDAVIVHPGFLMGSWDWKPSSGKMLLAIARKQIPLAPAGGCSAVDVRDVVHGIIQAVIKGRSGEHYILGGHNILYVDLFREMAEVTGGRAPGWVMNPSIARIGGWIGDTLTKVMGRETDFNSAMIQMGQIRHFYSSQKAQEELGYNISPLKPAIQRAWDFVRQHHQGDS